MKHYYAEYCLIQYGSITGAGHGEDGALSQTASLSLGLRRNACRRVHQVADIVLLNGLHHRVRYHLTRHAASHLHKPTDNILEI
jgi:hypothetical protein